MPTQLLIEGLDRLGKDTLIDGIRHRLGYHQVLHFTKPQRLDLYTRESPSLALRRYQEESFRILFQLLRDSPESRVICNRAHLGECVYAPIYRGYSGDYVFEIERSFEAPRLAHTRLILLTEDFSVSRHFADDGLSLGGPDKRRDEQELFLAAFEQCSLPDKRIVCVTDGATGTFRSKESILDEALA